MAEDQSPTDITSEHTESTPKPRTHVDSTPLPTDSLVTINLSEAGRASCSTTGLESAILDAPEADLSDEPKPRSSLEIISGAGTNVKDDETLHVVVPADRSQSGDWTRSSSSAASRLSKGRSQSISDRSDRSIEVDWDELDKTEEREDADAEGDEVSCIRTYFSERY